VAVAADGAAATKLAYPTDNCEISSPRQIAAGGFLLGGGGGHGEGGVLGFQRGIFEKETAMTLRMNLGLCYRMVFADGTSIQFRYLGTDASDRPLVQCPPEGGARQVLTRTDVKDFYEIDVPSEELEKAGI
jgi:hypothetical protein